MLEAIEKSNIPILVQAHDWAKLPESFHREIERDYVVLQKGAKKRSTVAADRWRETDYGTFRHDFQVDSLCNLCSNEGGIQTGPFGSQLHQEDYVPVGTPIITVEHLGENRIIHRDLPRVSDYDRNRLSRYTLRQGDIVFSRVGSVDRRSLVREAEEGWLFSGRCLRVRPDVNKIDPAYLSYFFGLPAFQEHIRSIAVGATMPSLNTQILSSASIVYPPLPEQRAIAHVLGTLDDKIELNRRMNETLEAMARALFKSWFVAFEPIRAKMEGRWRPGESLPGLPTEHYDLFPDRLVDSELGEIPKGWEVKALGVVVELNPKEPMKRRTLAPYLDMAALPTSGSSPDASLLREFKSGTRFRNGDTLLARITPCLENGKTAFVQSLQDGEVGWGSTEFIVLRAIPPVPPEYTYLLARDAAFREHAIQSMTGTSGRQRVQVDALAPYLLPSPPAETWNEFRALVNRLFAQVEFNRKESLALAAQRDALLPRLVSGELAVGTE